jgi:hypothetical protein
MVTLPVSVWEETDAMAPARYEFRLNGTLSERARSAFWSLDVASVPRQTIVFGHVATATDLADLLAQCSAMGLEVVSVRRLPDEAATGQGSDHAAPVQELVN